MGKRLPKAGSHRNSEEWPVPKWRGQLRKSSKAATNLVPGKLPVSLALAQLAAAKGCPGDEGGPQEQFPDLAIGDLVVP